jgi:ATP-dependent DNA helicase 2 subunit 1
LAFHNEQLQASAFREEYDPSTFEDLTLPKLDMIHKVGFPKFSQKYVTNSVYLVQRAGKLIRAWKEALAEDPSAGAVVVTATGATKRKADVSVNETEVRSMYENGLLGKVRPCWQYTSGILTLVRLAPAARRSAQGNA